MITGNFLLLAGNQSLRVGCPLQKEGLQSCETTCYGVFAHPQVQPCKSVIRRPEAEQGLPSETRLNFLAAFIRGETKPGQTVPDFCLLCHLGVTLLY